MISNLYPLLAEMKARPALFTGEVSLKSIHIFLQGYSMALFQHQFIEATNFLSFNDWIAQKLGFLESTAGWANMILAVTLGLNPTTISWEEYFTLPVSNQQHQQSIEVFYNLLEDYKNHS